MAGLDPADPKGGPVPLSSPRGGSRVAHVAARVPGQRLELRQREESSAFTAPSGPG